MIKQEAKNLIEKTFSNNFSSEQYQKFVANLFKKYTVIDKMISSQYIKESFRQFIVKYKRVGKFEDNEGNKIDILEVYLSKESILERARTAQRNFVAKYLEKRDKEAALVAFISPNNKEWRLSLVKLEHTLDIVNDKLKTKEEITPAKRWSFLVGENEGSHTAQSRFVDMLITDEDPNLKELELAFDIETVTKEFFNKYTELFFQLKEHLDELLEKDERIKKDFEEKEISTVDFAKKTLGQIVFLYFLQKKGWFGVAPDKNWGEGPKKFLRELFNRKEKYGKNFFNDILEPLFYEALAQDRGKESIYPRLNNCRMPFLNGGLFEPMLNYSWETTNIIIPDELFSNEIIDPKTKDKGTGIFDVFDRYNFTVNENEPLEKEVAVDPEMLGKVFENLLDIKDRKSKGTFYTPREIVHYMCQESLINYLETETNNEIPREDLEFFIQKGDRIIENDKIYLERKAERDKKYGINKYKDTTYKSLLPESIRNRADKLDESLQNIKVADLAVGSGAFPLGMINEIVRARKVLNVYLKKDVSDYDFKKYAITHSIYGVDIDPGAVDIAKLRLWLALVVDEEEPHPLPNLEYKIMQGNSLISEYEEIKLFDESIFEDTQGIEKEKIEINNKLSALQREYFELHKDNELTVIKKGRIEKEIKSLQRRLKSFEEKTVISGQKIGLFDLPQTKRIAQEKTRILQKKIEQFINESRRTVKQNLKEEIDNLKWELIEATLEEQGKTEKLKEIKQLRHKNIKPFFIWKLEFSDVFKEKGGFDVVIGNPPYIQLQKNGGFLADQLENSGYETFARTGDIYTLFYEQGNNLLHKQGHLAFITSNKWMRAGYGEKLRNYLAIKTNPKILIDLGPGVFETATVDTNILLFQKEKAENTNCLACSVKINLQKEKIPLEQYIKQNSVILHKFSSEAWIILNFIEQQIKDKIERIGTPLKDWDIKINRGVLTGFNEAFIIDRKKKDKLIAKDPKSAEIIKPILRGKDIKRYYADFADKWLITSHNGYIKENGEKVEAINIENYPAIKEWLDEHWEKISKRQDQGKTPYNLRNCAYQEEFENEKIVWQEMVQEGMFLFDDSGLFCNDTGRIMTGENLKFLLSILNSKIFFFGIRNFYGGGGLGAKGIRMKHTFFENFCVPKIFTDAQKPFIDLVNQILEITSAENYDPKNSPIEQKELEKKIDEMVYELYGLTEEETGVVEGKNK